MDSHETFALVDMIYSSGRATPGTIIPLSSFRCCCICRAVAAKWTLLLKLDGALAWHTSILVLRRLEKNNRQKIWIIVRCRKFDQKWLWSDAHWDKRANVRANASSSTYTVIIIICCSLHDYICWLSIYFNFIFVASLATQAMLSELYYLLL